MRVHTMEKSDNSKKKKYIYSVDTIYDLYEILGGTVSNANYAKHMREYICMK